METEQEAFPSSCMLLFFCVFLRKKTADFFKDVNLCVTQNTTASQLGQDITVVLHSICESCYDIPGH